MNYRAEWGFPAAILGAITLLFVPYLGLIVALALLMVATAAVLGLLCIVVASPFLLAGAALRRWR